MLENRLNIAIVCYKVSSSIREKIRESQGKNQGKIREFHFESGKKIREFCYSIYLLFLRISLENFARAFGARILLIILKRFGRRFDID